MKFPALFSLQGRRALITGSGQGLGLRFARALADAGASVVLNDIDPARLESAVQTLRTEGANVSGLIFNVAKAEEVRSAISGFERDHGPIAQQQPLLRRGLGPRCRPAVWVFAQRDGSASICSASRAS